MDPHPHPQQQHSQPLSSPHSMDQFSYEYLLDQWKKLEQANFILLKNLDDLEAKKQQLAKREKDLARREKIIQEKEQSFTTST